MHGASMRLFHRNILFTGIDVAVIVKKFDFFASADVQLFYMNDLF